MDPLVDLLAFARRAGLRLRIDDRGRLAITGPPAAEVLAQALLAHRDVLVDWLRTGRVRLDWSGHRVARDPAPCRRCGHPALVRDSADRPMHQVYAEQAAQRRLLDITAPGDGPNLNGDHPA